MKNYHFTVIVQQDEEGNYLAICPALQGCYAEGETPEEALESLKDAIHLHIEDRIERGETIYEEIISERLNIAA
ncbi:type II toxin-antitoxin system HicB family antitoxin [Larkinella sp. GY13]|uniref:type II toxin-antitoxin system HicB family antitoxin n=1 Tax=Larkinella sp. GY13 TaxID=3453720 RepID=UPI003EE91613